MAILQVYLNDKDYIKIKTLQINKNLTNLNAILSYYKGKKWIK